MKHLAVFLLLTLIAPLAAISAAIPGTVVLNKITLGDTTATNKSIGETVEMKGTPKQVADLTARDAVPAARRTEGMECWVVSENKSFRLVGGISNTNWLAVTTSDSIHNLYVSATGNNSTAQRGNPSLPWATLYDFDGTNNSGVCTVATNLDTIFVVGTNYAAVVPLAEGVTLQGLTTNSAIFFTNRMAFTNNFTLFRSAQLAGGADNFTDIPHIALSARCTVRDLFIDSRDYTYAITNLDAKSYISTFASGVGNSQQYELWVLDNTNYAPRPYSEFPLLGFTNRPGPSMLIQNCRVWANFDVVYFNFYGLSTVYHSSTNSAGYNSGTYTGTEWGATELAMTWTTNSHTYPLVELTIDKSTRFDSYWDYIIVTGARLTVTFMGQAHVHGLGGGNGVSRGPVVTIYSDGMYYDGGTHYLSYVTNQVLNSVNSIIGGPAQLLGAVFFNSNTTAATFTIPSLISGHYYDGIAGKAYSIGGTTSSTNFIGDGLSVTNLSASNFKLGQIYYTSNLVFSGSSIAAINGNYEWDSSIDTYTNAAGSFAGFDATLKYYVSDSTLADNIFTNATGLTGPWFLNAGVGTVPTSAWVGASNFVAGRVDIPVTFLPTNSGIIYMDSVSGNDWNWKRGRADLPLKTLEMLERVILPNDVVHLLSGNYTNPAMNLPEGVRFKGAGMHETIIYTATGATPVFGITNGCEVSDFTINGAIFVRGGTNMVRNVRSVDLSDNIYVEQGVRVRIIDCDLFSSWNCISSVTTNTAAIIDVIGTTMETTGAGNDDARAVFNSGAATINISGGRIKVRNNAPATTTAAVQSTTNSTGSVYLSGVRFDLTNGVVKLDLGSGDIVVTDWEAVGTNSFTGNGWGLTNLQSTNIVYGFKYITSTNYTLQASDVIVEGSGTNQVVTLLNATTAPLARFYTFVLSSTNAGQSMVITNATGAQSILSFGTLSQTLTNGQSLTIFSDGANWR